MSLEQKIEELTGAVTALAAVMQQSVANQERLLAGQEKAIAVVAAGNPATASTRGRKPKADTPPPSDEPADTASGEEDAGSASEGNSVGAAESASTTESPAASKSDAPAADKPKAGFAENAKKWLDKAEKGSEEYKQRGANIMAILGNFGAGKMSELKDEHQDKAMFFLKRAAKGLPTTFDAAYDFSGPADQPEPVAETAAASDDDDDMFN